MTSRRILDFYKQTSLYTDLGLYKDFARQLPDDINELCILNRNQVIHPFDLSNEQRNNTHSFYGDMTKVPKTTLIFENDLFPTAIAMLSELLRRDVRYSSNRRIEDKIHVCCREMSILLVSILKAKGIPARCRSGFAKYASEKETQGAGDHWITEYYNLKTKKWVLVDSDMCYDEKTLNYYGVDFSLFDVPRNKFIFGAEAYLGMRNNKYKEEELYYASNPATLGLKAAIRALFYDFHCLMNDEIIFLHQPKYIQDKNFILSEEEYQELDTLANLILNPDENFELLQKIWNEKVKFRILSGALN